MSRVYKYIYKPGLARCANIDTKMIECTLYVDRN